MRDDDIEQAYPIRTNKISHTLVTSKTVEKQHMSNIQQLRPNPWFQILYLFIQFTKLYPKYIGEQRY